MASNHFDSFYCNSELQYLPPHQQVVCLIHLKQYQTKAASDALPRSIAFSIYPKPQIIGSLFYLYPSLRTQPIFFCSIGVLCTNDCVVYQRCFRSQCWPAKRWTEIMPMSLVASGRSRCCGIWPDGMAWQGRKEGLNGLEREKGRRGFRTSSRNLLQKGNQRRSRILRLTTAE